MQPPVGNSGEVPAPVEPAPPVEKRAVAFFDGQNLFHAAKERFGYYFPNYDPKKLATMISQQEGWRLAETRFYTGIPHPKYDWERNQFWQKKLSAMVPRRGQDVRAAARVSDGNCDARRRGAY